MLNKIKKHNKIILTFLSIMLVVMLVDASGFSRAGFTDEKVSNNSMKMGDLKLRLDVSDTSIPFIEPGATYGVNGSVKNIGQLEGEMRITITPTFVFEDNYKTGYFYESDLPTENVDFNFTPEFGGLFTQEADGSYYSNEPIRANQLVNIFDSISFDYHLTGNEYQPDNKNVYFAYQVKAETRQVPKNHMEEINGVEVSYNIPNDDWEFVETELSINGQPIHSEAPEFDLVVESIERVGNQIVATFDREIESLENFLVMGSIGGVPLLKDYLFIGNNLICSISEEALLPENLGNTYNVYVRELYNMQKIKEVEITIE